MLRILAVPNNITRMPRTCSPSHGSACISSDACLTLAQKTTVDTLAHIFLARHPLGNHDSLNRICNLTHEETLVELQLANGAFRRLEYLKRHGVEGAVHGHSPYTVSDSTAIALTRPLAGKKKKKRRKHGSRNLNLNKPLPKIKSERQPFWSFFRQGRW